MTARRDPFDPTDPAYLQPEQRQREVAEFLAAGVIRMRERRRAVAATAGRRAVYTALRAAKPAN